MRFLGVVMVAFRAGTIMVDVINLDHHSLPCAVVVRAAERHGRGGSTLYGNRQHQQPRQQRPDEQPHALSVPRRTCRVVAKENTCAPVEKG